MAPDFTLFQRGNGVWYGIQWFYFVPCLNDFAVFINQK